MGFEAMFGIGGRVQIGLSKGHGLRTLEERDKGGDRSAMAGLKGKRLTKISLCFFSLSQGSVFEGALVVELGGGPPGDFFIESQDGGADVVMRGECAREEGQHECTVSEVRQHSEIFIGGSGQRSSTD